MKKIFTLAAAAIAGVLLVGCSTEVGTSDVKDIQKEAAKSVPKDLGQVPPELAQKGLANPTAGAKPGQKGAYMRNNMPPGGPK